MPPLRVQFDQRRALLILLALLGRASRALGTAMPPFLPHDADRFRERDLFHLHNELEDVSAHPRTQKQ